MDRQALSRKANRPAVRNVPRRDDWSTINTPDDRFGQYAHRVADQARYNYEAPQRAWDNLQHSHRVALAGGLDAAGEKQFKQDRRDWNRKFKYTPVGIMASGVDLDDNPFGAQDLYHDMSAQLHFDAPKLMDRMYPFSRGIGRLFNAAVENIGPLGWLNRIIPKRDPIVPENVLAMRDRFSPADILKGDIASYPVEEVDEVSDLDLFEPYVANSQMDMTHLYPYHGRGELSEDFDYSQFPSVVEEVIDEDVTDDSVVENIEEVIEAPDDEEIFNQTYEFIQDRGDDPDLPTPWEYMIKMQDLLGWEDERMIQHLIDNGVLRAK